MKNEYIVIKMKRIIESIMQTCFIHKLFMLFAVIMFLGMSAGTYMYNDIYSALFIFFFSILTLWLVVKYRKIEIKISNQTYRYSMMAIFIFFLLIQGFIVYNIPLGYYSDFIVVRDQAIHFSRDYHIQPQFDTYFHFYPYQINIVIVIDWLYRILGDYSRVELFSAAIVNMSAILAGMTVFNVSRNKLYALFTAIFCNIFSVFCLKTYMPYTNNIGMIFPILMLYVYSADIKKIKKILLISIIVVVGSRIKITTIIPFIGLVLIEAYYILKTRDYKTLALSVGTIVVLYGCFITLHNALLNKMEYKDDPVLKHGFVYYFAMGQNSETAGQYSKEIGTLGDSIYQIRSMNGDEYFRDKAISYVKERSIIGHIKFFVGKIAYCWGEVRTDHLKFFRYDNILIAIQHYTWYFALLLMCIGVFLINHKKYMVSFLGIMGVVAYLYLSEAGARYAIMYAPIVFAMMGWTMSKIKKI